MKVISKLAVCALFVVGITDVVFGEKPEATNELKLQSFSALTNLVVATSSTKEASIWKKQHVIHEVGKTMNELRTTRTYDSVAPQKTPFWLGCVMASARIVGEGDSSKLDELIGNANEDKSKVLVWCRSLRNSIKRASLQPEQQELFKTASKDLERLETASESTAEK